MCVYIGVCVCVCVCVCVYIYIYIYHDGIKKNIKFSILQKRTEFCLSFRQTLVLSSSGVHRQCYGMQHVAIPNTNLYHRMQELLGVRIL